MYALCTSELHKSLRHLQISIHTSSKYMSIKEQHSRNTAKKHKKWLVYLFFICVGLVQSIMIYLQLDFYRYNSLPTSAACETTGMCLPNLICLEFGLYK